MPPPAVVPPTPGERFAPVELNPKIQAHLRPVQYEGASDLQGRVNQVIGWEKWPMEKRIAFLRAFVQDTSRDPAIARKATSILRAAGVPVRSHRAQWSALLKWVQKNVYYVNERDERLQSPQYTLTELHGDCDDCAILLAALGDSLRLPWRFTISGRGPKGKVRWVEGSGPVPPGCTWTHIYLCVGWPPFKPELWTFAEPTLDVPLGWDTMQGKAPKGRADLGAADVTTSLTSSSAAPVASEAPSGGVSRAAAFLRGLPWGTIAGSFIASVGSFYATRAIAQRRR